MAATLIAETDTLEVASLSVLIYGPPGAWKTSVAQTAEAPLTLDFDRGLHRSFNRRTGVRFDAWHDVAEVAEGSAMLQGKRTVVIDTVGRMLDLLAADIIRANAKHGSATGGLSLQGFGALKNRFAHWMGQVRLGGRDVVMIAHEKEEKDGEDRFFRPDIQGSSYTEVMKFTDVVCYLGFGRDGKRTLDANPSDRHLGKNAAGWMPLSVPNLAESKAFLADLIADAKRKIGHTAAASAAAAKAVQEWRERLDSDPTLEQLNAMLPDLGKLTNGVKAQAWHLVQEHAKKAGLSFDKASRSFVAQTNGVPA